MLISNVQFKRSLKTSQIVVMGLAWMTPMIYFTVYGVVFETADGLMTPAYIVAFLAIVFTAYSYSRMVKVYPTGGSAYTYTSKAIHPKAGFLVGWALLIDYLFSPIIAILTFGIFMHAEFPSIPIFVWIIIMNIVLAVVNIIGIGSAARISGFSVLVQIGFILIFCLLTAKDIVLNQGAGALFTLEPLLVGEGSFVSVFSGASLICFCFLGFDAVTTMAEETIDSKKTIPRAIFYIIFIAITLYAMISFLTSIAFPTFSFANPDNAAYSLIQMVGGNLFSTFFIMVLIIATFTQGLSSMTSVTRFLYALGEASILPKKVFTSLHPKLRTPILNILFVSTISLSAIFINLDTAVLFVSFGALTGFIFVNLSVISHYYIKERNRGVKATFFYLVFPSVGVLFIGWLWTLLDPQTLWIGGAWVAFGFIYLFLKNRITAPSIRNLDKKLV